MTCPCTYPFHFNNEVSVADLTSQATFSIVQDILEILVRGVTRSAPETAKVSKSAL